MMGSTQREFEICESWSVHTHAISQPGYNSRFVMSDPILDAVTERTTDEIRVFHECVDCGTYRPAALILQFLRQVPVVERHEGRHICFKQTIHQLAIEIQSLLIDLAAPPGQHTRPRNGKAIGLQAQLFH